MSAASAPRSFAAFMFWIALWVQLEPQPATTGTRPSACATQTSTTR